MGKSRGESRTNVGQNGQEQTLLTLLWATYNAARHRRLSPEDSEDAAGQEVLDFLNEWAHSDAEHAPESVAGDAPLLSEEKIDGRANAAAHEVARRCRREREHRANASGSEAEDVQPYANLADPRPSPQQEAQARALLEAIVESLADLPGETGAQLWDHHVGGVSLSDLGRRHGCSAVAIYKRLLRVLPQIRAELARREWDETGSA